MFWFSCRTIDSGGFVILAHPQTDCGSWLGAVLSPPFLVRCLRFTTPVNGKCRTGCHVNGANSEGGGHGYSSYDWCLGVSTLTKFCEFWPTTTSSRRSWTYIWTQFWGFRKHAWTGLWEPTTQAIFDRQTPQSLLPLSAGLRQRVTSWGAPWGPMKFPSNVFLT